MKLTILTPTYNRGKQLVELYHSLQNQTSNEFEWLIIDDGSTDNTRELVSEWIASKNMFNIIYKRKENGGKHTALNCGIKIIQNELTFIVDSDDVLTNDAVEVVLRYHRRYGVEENLCGYAFLRAFPDGTINGKQFIPNEYVASYIDVRINGDDSFADKAEVFKTKCLKEFPFPEYPNEKFLGEDIIWMRMAKKYMMVHINKAIYIGNYQSDGLTRNRRIHNIKSPLGCMYRAKEFMYKGLKPRYRIKAALQYIVYGKFARKTCLELMKEAPEKKLVLLFFIPGMILYFKWKREFKIISD